MRCLTILLLGAFLFVFGCSGNAGNGGPAGDGGASSGTEVANTCPSCGETLVDGKCAT